MRSSLLLVVLASLALRAVPAGAQEDGEDARRLFDAGVAAVAAGDFAAALEAFVASRVLNPTATVTFNIALCHRELGEYPVAVSTLRGLLDERGGDSLPADRRERAEELVREMAPRVGVLRLTVGEPGAAVVLDGEEIGDSPIDATRYVEPGVHSAEARWADLDPERETVTVPGGLGESVTLALFRPDVDGSLRRPDPGDPDGDGEGIDQWWFWGTASGAGALGIAAVIAGALAYTSHEDWVDGDRSDAGLRDRGQSLELAANVLAGCAGAAAVAGLVVFFFVDFDGEEAPEDPGAVDVGLLPGGLALRW